MDLKSYSDKVSRYFAFDKKEWIHFATITLVLAFIFSFKEWGAETFDLFAGLSNLLIAVVIAGISILVHHSMQRLVAIQYGYKATHSTVWSGIIIGLLAAIFTNGNIPILVASSVSVSFLPIHRLGKHRFGVNIGSHGIIAFSGPLANLLLAGIVKVINFGANSAFLDKLVLFNILFAVYNMIPMPPLDGGYILWASRLLYSFAAGVVIGFIALYLILNLAFPLATLGALIFGFVCFIAFYVFYEIRWG